MADLPTLWTAATTRPRPLSAAKRSARISAQQAYDTPAGVDPPRFATGGHFGVLGEIARGVFASLAHLLNLDLDIVFAWSGLQASSSPTHLCVMGAIRVVVP